MNKYPKLVLKKDKKLDSENGQDFLGDADSLTFKKWFLPDELHYLLKKNVSEKERNFAIKNYVDRQYSERSKELAAGVEKAKKDWGKIEKRYFEKVAKIFDNHPWPKGNFVGFASIFFMYPRWIEKKRFAFPCDHKYFSSNNVIAHEMLHFIFFDFILKNYGLDQNSIVKGKGKMYVWQVSEVFNNVVLNSKIFSDILKANEKPYPGTEKIYQRMKRQWAKKQEAKWLLEQWFGK